MYTKTQAKILASVLKKKLGKKWKVEVWENLGWHYRATNGPVSLSESFNSKTGKPEYHAMMTDKMEFVGCGSVLWTDSKFHRTPDLAVADVVTRAENVVNNLRNIVGLGSEALLSIGDCFGKKSKVKLVKISKEA